jgi:hypothetical protein
MTRKSRYFLITICIVVFFGLAPVIVFYVRGIKYDQANNSYLPTGLLSISSEPKGAQVYLDDKAIDTTPADVRFLKPGGYNMRVESPGYQTWTKRVQIIAGRVTWIKREIGKIFLFLQNPKIANVADNVSDFYKLSRGWLYLSGNNLIITSDDSGNSAQIFPLPKTADKISASGDSSFFLLEKNNTRLLFNLKSKKITDLSTTLKDYSSIQFDGENNLWGVAQNTLMRLETKNLKQTSFAKNASAFTIRDDSLYYLQKNGPETGSLFFFSITNPDESSGQELVQNIPLGKDTKLLVTEQKEIFVLADSTLSRINGAGQKLAEGILGWNYDQSANSLIFTTANELDFYNFSTNQVQLITRSSDHFAGPSFKPEIGYAFYIQNDRLFAAESETSDPQNTYVLASLSGKSKFTVDATAKKVYLLDSGKLQLLTVR